MAPEDPRIAEPGPDDGDATRIISIPPANREGTAAGQGGAATGGTLGPGTILAHTYRIVGLLARGGMGEVYRAVHVELQTEHAIKVIRPELASDPKVLELFRREATSLRNVRNDAVVAYDGVFRDEDGRLYLVMEFVSGPPLSDIVRRGPLPSADVRVLLERLAGGLAAAHDKGIVHRDMSPDNVILPEERVERAKIIDFGIAKMTDPGQATVIGDDFAGKYSFVSPEQLGMFGGRVNQCSDIYSLALVLAAAALGKPLDMGGSHASVIEARRAVPDLSGIPDTDLRRTMEAMLEPDPANRPEGMRALIAMLGSASEARAASTPASDAKAAETGAGTTKAPPPRRGIRPAWAAAGFAALVALLAGGGFWVLNEGGAHKAAETSPPLLTPQTPPAKVATAPPPQPAPAVPAPSAATPAPAQPAPPSQPVPAAPAPVSSTPVAPAAAPQPAPAPNPQPSAAVQPSSPPEPAQTSPLGQQIAALPTVPPAKPASDEALRSAISDFSCAHLVLTRGPDGARVEGFVRSKDDLAQLRAKVAAIDGSAEVAANIHDWPFCSALEILETRTAFEGPDAPKLRLNNPDGRYVGGDRLRVDVTASPREKGYLYVVYLMSDGTVAHLLPMPLRADPAVARAAHVVLGEERDYRIGPPYGRDMILALWSDRPLALGNRPEVEPAKDFLAALKQALEPKIVGAPRLASAYTYLVSRQGP